MSEIARASTIHSRKVLGLNLHGNTHFSPHANTVVNKMATIFFIKAPILRNSIFFDKYTTR